MLDRSQPLPADPPSTSGSIGAGLLAMLERMAGELTDLEQKSRELAAGYEHLDEQIRLATQVQRDLLPGPRFAAHGAEVQALYRPADRVSGDIYDVVRLDETHVAISIADATGHGVPAALLTVFIKRSFKGKEIFNGSYRIVPPDEILLRLNRDILDAHLSRCRFVTALHAVYDESRRRLHYARGGMPYPIVIPAAGPARPLPGGGGLIGVFETNHFESIEVTLNAGDRVLFFTDGLSALIHGRDCKNCSPDIIRTDWFSESARLPADELFAGIDQLLQDTPPDDWPEDDITVIALDVADD